jgi:hypothetical protein
VYQRELAMKFRRRPRCGTFRLAGDDDSFDFCRSTQSGDSLATN